MSKKNDLMSLRKEYLLAELDINQVSKSPYSQFEKWFEEAKASKLLEPNAMNLSTVASDGFPSSRVVLMKDFSERGITFFTNYNSRKGKEIQQNPKVSINFFWAELQRQIRIQGLVEKTSEKESDEYFNSRPEGSQIGSWSSPQSQTLENRKQLEDLYNSYLNKFSGENISRPEHWGGFLVKPILFEFWQGRENRLHDRIVYLLDSEQQTWIINRVAP